MFGVIIEEEWLIYLGVAVGCCFGMFIGDWLHDRLNYQVVILSLVSLVLASSAMLAEPGNGTTFGWVVLPLFVLMPFLLFYLIWLKWNLSTYTSRTEADVQKKQASP